MQKRTFIVIAAALAAVQAAAQPFTNAPVAPRQEPVTEERYGIRVEDPYRWMEEPAKAEEMATWVKGASAHAIAQLERLPTRAAFAQRLEQTSRAGVRYTDVQSANGRLFYRRLDPADRVPKLVVRDADGTERVLFDPTAGTTEVSAISNYSVAPDGRSVAVHVARGGGEVGETRFLTVADGRQWGSTLGPIWGEFQVTWIDSSRIAYTRMTAADGADPMQNMRVYVTDAGRTGPGQAVLGSGIEGGPAYGPNEFPKVATSPASDWAIGLGTGARADARLLVARAADLAAGRPAWREVAGYDDRINGVALRGDRLYLLSTRDNSRGVVTSRTLTASGMSAPVRVLARDDLVLTGLVGTRDGLYVTAQSDGVSRLLFLPGGRGPARDVALPVEGSIYFLEADSDGRSITFALTGWFSAPEFYRASGGRVASLGLRSATWPGAARFTSVREEAVSADGTRVPMVILLPEGGRREGGLPTILEGYGSYGASMLEPGYNAYETAWLAQGGASALCGTRGGGERGRDWHEGGRAAAKPAAQADFIACAERLIAAGYTTSAQLVGTGTSAGGLLVPPAALRRPDLFTAIIPRVAVLNATRLDRAENGANQFAEMGDPSTAEGYRALAAQDAYLMLASAQDTPDMLITVGLNDRRVAPWMAAKFAARAQSRFGDRRTILVRADPEAGHGIGSARDRTIAEWADTYAFAWAQAGGR